MITIITPRNSDSFIMPPGRPVGPSLWNIDSVVILEEIVDPDGISGDAVGSTLRDGPKVQTDDHLMAWLDVYCLSSAVMPKAGHFGRTVGPTPRTLLNCEDLKKI